MTAHKFIIKNPATKKQILRGVGATAADVKLAHQALAKVAMKTTKGNTFKAAKRAS